MYKKTLTYSVQHMIVAMIVAYTISGSWQVALGIGIIEPLAQTVSYYFHERIWAKIALKRNQSLSTPL